MTKQTKTGNIPEKLKFFIRGATDVHWRWDDVEGGEITNKVYPCYISDATNKKTLESGERWAKGRYYGDNKNFSTLEIDNKPFKNLRIITLEIRDKGGRAYKVCADIGGQKDLFFDARECIILDSMFKVGISKGGIIEGDFIFAKVGAQMMPVRIGSYLYTKMVEATKYDEAKPIGDLVVGGIYKNKRGDEAVYLGQYWAREPEIELDIDNAYRYDRKKIKTLTLSKPALHHVFTERWKYEEYGHNATGKWVNISTDLWFHSKDDTGYNQLYVKGDPIGYHLTIIKKHSFKEKVGQIEVPENYIEKFKEKEIQVYNRPKYLSSYPLMSENGLYRTQAKLLTLSKDRDFVHPLLKQFTHK